MELKQFKEQLSLEFKVKPAWLDMNLNTHFHIWPLLQVAANQLLELITKEKLHIDRIINLSRDYNTNLSNIFFNVPNTLDRIIIAGISQYLMYNINYMTSMCEEYEYYESCSNIKVFKSMNNMSNIKFVK